MRRAVVDIGTNSTRLLIADVDDGQGVGRARAAHRDHAARSGRRRRRALARAGDGARVLRRSTTTGELIDRARASDAVAVLTSAVRDAANGAEFARTVGDRYGLEPHVLSGDEEARLTFLGATSERDADDLTPTLVIDIGGGSTEFVHRHRPRRDLPRLDPGRRGAPDRAPPAHRPACRRGARCAGATTCGRSSTTACPRPRAGGVEHAIAVAGTATSIARDRPEPRPVRPGQGPRLRGESRGVPADPRAARRR